MAPGVKNAVFLRVVSCSGASGGVCPVATESGPGVGSEVQLGADAEEVGLAFGERGRVADGTCPPRCHAPKWENPVFLLVIFTSMRRWRA